MSCEIAAATGPTTQDFSTGAEIHKAPDTGHARCGHSCEIDWLGIGHQIPTA